MLARERRGRTRALISHWNYGGSQEGVGRGISRLGKNYRSRGPLPWCKLDRRNRLGRDEVGGDQSRKGVRACLALVASARALPLKGLN